jgi:hypothetical protein
MRNYRPGSVAFSEELGKLDFNCVASARVQYDEGTTTALMVRADDSRKSRQRPSPKEVPKMKFFIPDVTDADQAEQIWQATTKFAKQTLGWQVTDRRIFRITYHHGEESHHAEVGKCQQREDSSGRRRPMGAEPVLAILQSNAYLVCTPTRGVLSGMPILVGQDELTWAEDFEQ